MKNEVCGLTTEGNRVWETNQDGWFMIEGRYENQHWPRHYSQIFKWVKFFKTIKRSEHIRWLKDE